MTFAIYPVYRVRVFSRRVMNLIMVLPAAVLVMMNASCATTIGVDPAPHATDPLCASVMLSTPDSLGDDLQRIDTTSQATTAWGTAGAAVTMRCGVESPGPSPQCQSVESADGTTVDWIVANDDSGTWVFTTYGREPAVEVVIPPDIKETHTASFVIDLAGAVKQIPSERTCQ